MLLLVLPDALVLTNHGYLNGARHGACRLLSQVKKEINLKPLFLVFTKKTLPSLFISQVGEPFAWWGKSCPPVPGREMLAPSPGSAVPVNESAGKTIKLQSLLSPLRVWVVLGTFGSSHPRADLCSLLCLARSNQERIQHWLWNEGGGQNPREHSPRRANFRSCK